MTNTLVDKSRLERHPNYKIMDLNPEELNNELKTWERLRLIDWLCWNDKNGIYDDINSIREFGHILQKDDAIEIIINQIHY
ncbi:MAG: hypothetical protein IPN86_12090 [Saprospiraceae bacterium]|nr:hypothetical protein [Saprospiraceae bacterium]